MSKSNLRREFESDLLELVGDAALTLFKMVVIAGALMLIEVDHHTAWEVGALVSVATYFEGKRKVRVVEDIRERLRVRFADGREVEEDREYHHEE